MYLHDEVMFNLLTGTNGVIFMEYRIIVLIIITISLRGQIILSYISNTLVIITHYKRTSSYVIIPKPNCASLEGINSRCRHFELLLFRRFGSICRHYDRSCRHSVMFNLFV